jgi:hypothetical protein
MRSTRWLVCACAWLALGAGEPADETAGKTAGETAAPASEAPAPLDLDRLLRVPGVEASDAERLGGRTRRSWYEEFERARADVAELGRRIQESQATLRSKAGGDWGFTPAGASAPTDPETLKLRADLRRDRQSLATAQKRLRDLEVEASLAGVPDDWRRSPE